MATITLGGNTVDTLGNLPAIGSKAPNFELTASDLSSKTLEDYKGARVILNIFPSIDTGICALSSKKFNEEASNLSNTKILCVSRDLPFAQKRFCAAEGVNNLEMLSDFKEGKFGKDYGVEMANGGMQGFHSRAVLILDEAGTVVYAEQVPEIGQEPDYTSALNALK